MLVKLKMKPIYKICMIIIGIFVAFLCLLFVSYFLYDKVKKLEYEVEVDGNISINYIDGKKFTVANEYETTFNVSNISDNTVYFYISIENVSDKLNFSLYDDKDKLLKDGSVSVNDEIILNDISIEKAETKYYRLVLKNDSKQEFLKGNIKVKVIENVVENFADVIRKNNRINETTITKPGIEIATTNEGLIQDKDSSGTTYYFRGNVDNNYVLINDLLWRIVRINGDDTVRLVLNNLTDNVSNIHATNSDINEEFDSSNMQSYLNLWLEDNLKDYNSSLANNKFCHDTAKDENNLYQSFTRLGVNYIPTFSCVGTTYNGVIGLLSADEVILAGGKIGTANNSYYLYNSAFTQEYFTMTAASGDAENIHYYMVNINGSLSDDVTSSLFRGVRPVINLIRGIEVTGTGILEDPYRIVK